MDYINIPGASFSVGFVKGFKKQETFVKAMDGLLPDLVGDERDQKLKDVWNSAHEKNPASETVETVKDSE